MEFFRSSFGVCGATPQPTEGHKWLGAAAVLGFAFVVTHVITVVVTCAEEGFDWGAAAWSLDMMGFLAGAGFSIICRNASNKNVMDNRGDLRWILVWSSITAGVRVLDTLMLMGVVYIPAIYITPEGAVLASNIVSEVIIGNLYVLFAVVGSVKCLFFQTNDGEHTLLETSEFEAMP